MMRSQSGSLCAIALLGCQMLAAQTKAATPAKPDAGSGSGVASHVPTEQTVNAFLHATFGYDPSFTYRVISIEPSKTTGMTEVKVALGPQGQEQTLYVTPDGAHAMTGEPIPFGAEPFRQAKLRLEREAKGPSQGAAGNALLLVEFTDLQCPHCKAAQPTIAKLLTDFPSARFVFENFPLESIHPWAFKAAAFAQCLGEQNKSAFFKFVDAVFADQDNITPENADGKLKDAVKQAGGDPQQTAACAASAAAGAEVKQSLDLGESLGVNGTPTLFVNGRPVSIGGVPYDKLKTIVQFDASRDK